MKRKLLISILLSATLILLSSTAIFAAAYLTFGWPSSDIPIKTYNYNNSWQPPLDASLSN